MKLNVRETVTFALLGALMWVSKMVMEALPNMHLLAVITVAITVVYRQKALYAIYVYVFLLGLFYGFPPWWTIHLYVWTVLWGITMCLPRRMHPAVAAVVYCAVCGLHGLIYGTLCAPVQVLFFGAGWEQLPAWILAGLPADAIHAVSNLVAGTLTLPFIRLLQRCEKSLGA